MATAEPTPGLFADPPIAAYSALIRSPAAAARAARREAGLPDDRPIIMSGHQASVWHAGILAKRLALEHASPLAAASAWLIADQDVNDPGIMAYPERDNAGRLQRREFRLTPPTRTPLETPTGCIPRLRATTPAPPTLATAAAAIVAEPGDSAALQVSAANERMLRDRLGLTATHLVPSLGLSRLTIFRDWVALMQADPARCVTAYNAAAEAAPEAQVRPLLARPDLGRWELPLWRIRPNEPRRPVFNVQVANIDPAELAPRALLMTAVVRAALCDLFIHGTGGGVYDKVTELWITNWLGIELAPMAIVSATLRLDLGVPDVTPADVARARWRSHAARHDPALIGDATFAAQKRDMVRAIAALKEAGEDPAPVFRAMHAMIAAYRTGHAAALASLDAATLRAQADAADARIASDRTWPWVLHTDAALRGLMG